MIMITSVPKLSLTQQFITNQRVNVPEIYVPDPININPNIIANVEKVLLHIETIRMERVSGWRYLVTVFHTVMLPS